MAYSYSVYRSVVEPTFRRLFDMEAFWSMLPAGKLEDWEIMQHAVMMRRDPEEIWEEAVKRGFIRPESDSLHDDDGD